MTAPSAGHVAGKRVLITGRCISHIADVRGEWALRSAVDEGVASWEGWTGLSPTSAS